MRRLLAALALVALFVARPAPAADSYVVTWTVIAIKQSNFPGNHLTGAGEVCLWTSPTRWPRFLAPPPAGVFLYCLPIPASCAGRERCTIAQRPLPDPAIMRHIIVYSPVGPTWRREDAGIDLVGTVTKRSGPI